MNKNAVGIHHAVARIDDAGAMARFWGPLESLSEEWKEAVRTKVFNSHSPMEGMTFDSETNRAFFIRYDGKHVECWTWDGIPSVETGAAMWALIADANQPMTIDLAKRVLMEATGLECQLVN